MSLLIVVLTSGVSIMRSDVSPGGANRVLLAFHYEHFPHNEAHTLTGASIQATRDRAKEEEKARNMGAVIQKNRPTPPLAMASDRSLSSASPSSRAPRESPCLAMASAGSSTTIQRLLPIRSARPRERFFDLLTMIDGKSMATLTCPSSGSST